MVTRGLISVADNQIYEVILQAVFSYSVLFVLSKILGKKQVAQLEITDYVIGISIGSIAAQMAVDPDIPTYHYVIAMLVFVLFDYFITIISRKGNGLKKLFKGKPLILIENGNLNFKNLKKSNLDLNELMSQCRIKGYFDVNQIAYCIFETNGDFSVMPKSYARELKAQDFKLPKEEPSLSNDIVIDGEVIPAALQKINQTQAWLFHNLQVTNKKDLKNILLASYNEQESKFYIHYKNPELERNTHNKQQKAKTLKQKK